MKILSYLFILYLLFVNVQNVFGQSFRQGASMHSSQNEIFNSVEALSNGNIVTTFNTEWDNIGIELPVGYGSHVDYSGTKSIICFNNKLTDVEWFVTFKGNDNMDICEVVVDEEDNSYVRFTGANRDPFVLNNDTLYAPNLTAKTYIIKINKFGEIVWKRVLDDTMIKDTRQMQIANGALYVMIDFREDIENPFGGILPTIGSSDYYITKISYDNELLDLYHIYCHVGSLLIQDFDISSDGNILLAAQTPMNLVVNGNILYSTYPGLIDYSGIFEISPDGTVLLNSIPNSLYTLIVEYNNDNNVLVAGKSSALVEDEPILGDTSYATDCGKFIFAGLTDDFEIDWIAFYYREYEPCQFTELSIADIAEDCRGNYYLVGRTEDRTRFGDFFFRESSADAGNRGDAFIVKTDSVGTPTWLGHGGGTIFSDQFIGVTVDNNGAAYAAGYYSGSCSFGSIRFTGIGGGMHTEAMLIRLQDAIPDYPVAELSAEISDICIGDTVRLEFDTTFAIDYSWLPVDMTDSLTFRPDTIGSYSYSLIAYDSLGCQDEVSINVEVHNFPDVAIHVLSEDICIGDSLILNPTGATTYLWEPEYISDTYHQPDEVGDERFILTGIDDYGCSNRDTIFINTHELPRIVDPVISHELMGEDGSIDIRGEGGNPPYTFDWDRDEIDDFDDTEDLTDLTEGLYTVRIKDNLGCINSDSYEVLSFLSLTGSDDPEILIYPNPAQDLLYINAENEFTYKIFNAAGSEIVQGRHSNNTSMIKIDQLNSGTYLIQLYQKEQIFHFKFVKL
ncbi:T9SS type A sorting domain-containing protein [Crocinitomix catalasitica]|uniref:T9SS type A sorting domain-containing protein n=1 Tax=Crocinitomix catalasitica TaxID=184607 RepID=UPI0004802207|nr:T9SS type A sorting domain-containing protein [Crocinitomix catalasitica]